tara:strand:+ start:294 stop:623 length:330 start_codon:yes stop_codon:yes gene_type:complete
MQKDNNKQMIVLERNIVQLVKRYSGTMTVLLNDISEDANCMEELKEMHNKCAGLLGEYNRGREELRKMFMEGETIMLLDLPDDEKFDMILVDFMDGRSLEVYSNADVNW